MSFTIINGKQVETLDFPDFFEPKPKSYKKNILFADNAGNIHFEIEELNIESILGKRKFCEEDDERYGQHIGVDFFKTNIGHNVIQN